MQRTVTTVAPHISLAPRQRGLQEHCPSCTVTGFITTNNTQHLLEAPASGYLLPWYTSANFIHSLGSSRMRRPCTLDCKCKGGRPQCSSVFIVMLITWQLGSNTVPALTHPPTLGSCEQHCATGMETQPASRPADKPAAAVAAKCPAAPEVAAGKGADRAHWLGAGKSMRERLGSRLLCVQVGMMWARLAQSCCGPTTAPAAASPCNCLRDINWMAHFRNMHMHSSYD
jgi:hypothetical protein